MAFVSTLLSLSQTSLKQRSPTQPAAAGLRSRATWCSAVQPPAEREKTAFSSPRTMLCLPSCTIARARLLHKCWFNRILHLLQDLVLQRSTGWGYDIKEYFVVRERENPVMGNPPPPPLHQEKQHSLSHAHKCFFLGSKLLVNKPTHMSRLDLFFFQPFQALGSYEEGWEDLVFVRN